MRIQTATHQFLEGMHRKQPAKNGRCKNQESQGLDATEKPQRGLKIPRIHEILPILHQRVFSDHQTATRPHQTNNSLALGQVTTMSIHNAQSLDVHETDAITTRLQQNVLPSN